MNNFAPNESFTVVFALLAADSLQQLLQVADSAQYYYNLSPVSIDALPEKTDDVSVYPNPASEKLYIKGLNPLLPVEIRLYTADGKSVMVTHHYPVNISTLKKGMYFMQIIQNNASHYKKIAIR